MEKERDDRVIYIKDMLFAALYQWRKALIAAVILALVLGAFSGIRQLTKIGDANAADSQALTAEDPADDKTILEQRYESVAAQIKSQEEYRSQSPLMSLDPNSVYHAYLDFTVYSDYQIQPDKTYQNIDPIAVIMRSYCALLTSDQLLNSLAETVGIPAKYASELISVNNNTSFDRSASIILTAGSRADAQALLDLVTNTLENAADQIAQATTTHELEILGHTIREELDHSLIQTQTAALDRLESLYVTYWELDAQLQQLTSSGSAFSKKEVILFAVIGGIVGVVAVFGFAIVSHITGNKIYSARTLTNRTGLKVLTRVLSCGKFNAIDLWLRRLEERSTDPADAALAAANIRNLCGKGSKVLVAGSCPESGAAHIVDALKAAGLEVVCAESLLSSVKALDAIPACDAVVLVLQCGVSTYTHAQRELQIVLDQNKPLLGCVLVDG